MSNNRYHSQRTGPKGQGSATNPGSGSQEASGGIGAKSTRVADSTASTRPVGGAAPRVSPASARPLNADTPLTGGPAWWNSQGMQSQNDRQNNWANVSAGIDGGPQTWPGGENPGGSNPVPWRPDVPTSTTGPYPKSRLVPTADVNGYQLPNAEQVGMVKSGGVGIGKREKPSDFKGD